MAGLAVAEGIKVRYPEAEIYFVSTGNAVEERCLEGKGFKFFKTKARAWKDSLIGMMVFLIGFLMSFIRCLWYWRELKPDVVFGLGGYASLVPVVCAFFRKVPILLLEQNAVPGKTTRVLAPLANGVLCSWAASGQWLSSSCRDKLRFTGTPLREAALGTLRRRRKTLGTNSNGRFTKKTGKSANAHGSATMGPTLLILGGSQGARVINSVVIEILPLLKKKLPGLRVIHSTGREDYERVREAYKGLGLEDGVFDFLEDMSLAYSSADLVISRAGATTLAEITAWGIPAVLVPYPYSADGHQCCNAKELADKGAAVVVEEQGLTVQGLARLLLEILTDRGRLQKMRRASKSMGKPSATQEVIKCMLELLGGGRRSSSLADGRQKRKRECQSLSPQVS